MDYPQYRKYVGKTTFFKIISEKRFEETSFIGDKKFKITIDAKQFPELLRIQDMLSCRDEIWEIIDETTYSDDTKD